MSEATKKRSRDEAAAEGETAAGAFAGAPAEAGELGYAHFWYYEDKEATQQGPFDAARMRQWLLDELLPDSTPVAPSYYGEVPTTFWPVTELYKDPQTHAFVLADDALASSSHTAAAEAAAPEFEPASAFSGKRQGYVFRSDHYGLGYYRDAIISFLSSVPLTSQVVPPKEITAESIAAEKEKKKFRAHKLSGQAMPRFDAIAT